MTENPQPTPAVDPATEAGDPDAIDTGDFAEVPEAERKDVDEDEVAPEGSEDTIAAPESDLPEGAAPGDDEDWADDSGADDDPDDGKDDDPMGNP